MSSFAPQPILTSRNFEIVENRRGYWVAKDKEGLIGGVFRSQKDALRFALFEVAGDSARVRLLTRPPHLPAEGTAAARPQSCTRIGR